MNQEYIYIFNIIILFPLTDWLIDVKKLRLWPNFFLLLDISSGTFWNTTVHRMCAFWTYLRPHLNFFADSARCRLLVAST